MARWRFLTNQALVLIHVYEHPRSTLRDIAAAVDITERAALSLLRQLEQENFVERAKEGRRNRYTVDLAAVLAAQTQGPYNVAQLVSRLANLAAQLRKAAGDEDGAPNPQADS
ncbi:MAG: MarR family transcriptional regulator [Dehalococcoidia bacterium]